MRSEAPTVDAYLAEVPAPRRASLQTIRALCLEQLPDHEEAMRYGMPAYLRNDVAEFAWASQARHISLYVMKEDVAAAHAARLAGQDMGKGCLRLRPSSELDVELIADLLDSTAASPQA